MNKVAQELLKVAKDILATKQELLYIPQRQAGEKLKVEWKGAQPKRVWTILDRKTKPTLPFKPVHNENVFLEDHMHDWIIRNGYFFYFSRISDGDVWLLLEF